MSQVKLDFRMPRRTLHRYRPFGFSHPEVYNSTVMIGRKPAILRPTPFRTTERDPRSGKQLKDGPAKIRRMANPRSAMVEKMDAGTFIRELLPRERNLDKRCDIVGKPVRIELQQASTNTNKIVASCRVRLSDILVNT
jgi:hypothetical protein